jgi:2-hydroxy-3-oxopropionate reductase
MTTTVGFVGLGIMGGPMAANLVKAGFDVVATTALPSRSGGSRRRAAAGRPAWPRPSRMPRW